jgi:hypothetical protein
VIPFHCFSQEDTKAHLDFEVAKKVALELVDYDRLREVDSLQRLSIYNLKTQISLLEDISNVKSEQIMYLENTQKILEMELKFARETPKKSNWLTWSLAVLGAFGTGYFIGTQF